MRMSLGRAGRHHCGVHHPRPSWVVCNGTGRTHGMHALRSVRHKYGEPAAFAGQDSADYRINAGRVREVLAQRKHFGSKQIAKARS
jgi:hypothetical protein